MPIALAPFHWCCMLDFFNLMVSVYICTLQRNEERCHYMSKGTFFTIHMHAGMGMLLVMQHCSGNAFSYAALLWKCF